MVSGLSPHNNGISGYAGYGGYTYDNDGNLNSRYYNDQNTVYTVYSFSYDYRDRQYLTGLPFFGMLGARLEL